MNTKNLPTEIPVFPLANAILFPGTILPLNIFEKRYIQLVDDCMKDKRLFGMIQPKIKTDLETRVYNVGCLGKIISFNETNDKRFIITLSGISRIKVKEELANKKLYREFKVDYSDFENDTNLKSKKEDYNLSYLLNKSKILFNKKDYIIDWTEIEKLDFERLISAICMIAPFSVEEKQKLIETPNTNEKLKVLEEIINFNLLDNLENKTIQ